MFPFGGNHHEWLCCQNNLCWCLTSDQGALAEMLAGMCTVGTVSSADTLRFSCKSGRKLINSLNPQHMECSQPPLKSRINGSCLRWGDTSLWLLICAPCKCKNSCRTAAVGKPPEGQGVPVATQSFSQIYIQPGAEFTWNYKSTSWATLKSKVPSQLLSIAVSTLTIIFSPLKQHSQL